MLRKLIEGTVKDIIKINIDFISTKNGISLEDANNFPEFVTKQILDELDKVEIDEEKLADFLLDQSHLGIDFYDIDSELLLAQAIIKSYNSGELIK